MTETTSTPDLSDTTVGQQIQAPFVLFRKERKSIKGGSSEMFKITLRNETGEIRGPVWEESMPDWEEIPVGSPVMVTARVEEGYNGGPNELKIFEAEAIDGPHPVLDALNPTYPGDLDELDARYEALVDQIEHPGLQRFLERFFETSVPFDEFRTAPAGMRQHHAYIHGLFEHTIEVAEMALANAEQPGIAEHVNRDIVLVGALIHDSGKTKEYEWQGKPIGMSRDAQLMGHITTGPIQAARTFETHREELEEVGFTAEHLKHLIHIQVSHHGELEYGSPVTPATIAAKCVQQADLASSQIRKMTEIAREHEPDEYGHVRGSGRGEHWKGILLDPPVHLGRGRPPAVESIDPAEDGLGGPLSDRLEEARAAAARGSGAGRSR